MTDLRDGPTGPGRPLWRRWISGAHDRETVRRGIRGDAREGHWPSRTGRSIAEWWARRGAWLSGRGARARPGPAWDSGGALRDSALAREAAALTGRAQARARADVAAGMYDQWSFDGERLLPYLQTLRASGERRVEAADLAIKRRASEARLAYEARSAELAVLERRLGHLQHRHDEAERMASRTLARMDRLATREARRREILRFVPWSRRPEPEAEPLDPAERAAKRQAEMEAAAQLGVAPMTEMVPYEGPQAPPIRAVARGLILAFLILIDLPVTYLVFRALHGDSGDERILALLLALPVATVMVLLPHIGGKLYRHRHATGRELAGVALATLLIVPWAGMVYYLGVLRAKSVLAPPLDVSTGARAINPATGEPYPTLIEQLGVEPVTIPVVFIALLLMTGGIGFLLGIAHEHPLQRAYRLARDRLRKLDGRLARLRPLVPATAPPSDEEVAARIEETARTIRAAVAAAEHAYLDGVGRAMGDPAVTDAIGRLSDRLANQREGGQP